MEQILAIELEAEINALVDHLGTISGTLSYSSDDEGFDFDDTLNQVQDYLILDNPCADGLCILVANME